MKQFRYAQGMLIGGIAFITAAGGISAQERLPAGARVLRLEAYPEAVKLRTPYDFRQLLVTAELASGDKLDVTRIASLQAPAKLATISPTGLVQPAGDGAGSIDISLAGQKLAVPLEVHGQKDKYVVSFVQDVMPAMSKLGCNAGTCHGAAQGKNGFKLSLRGYDPLADHQALTDDLEGRRFNRVAPEQSLMLLKPTGIVPHVGGAVMQPGEARYEMLKSWIADGVKLDLDSPRVSSLSMYPKAAVIPLPGMKQQMVVLATYSDGSVRDVSTLAFVETSNGEVATADKQGLITAVRRGEATMLARYEGAYTASAIVVMGDRSGFEWRQTVQYNYIDELVDAKLKEVKVLPSELCTDAEFIRRVYLDLTGLPPLPEDVRAFLNDKRPSRQKRDALIDKLVGSSDYIEYWTNKWADLLQVNRKFLGEKGAVALRNWIRQAIATNKPYHKFVHEILTASGSNIENPPASYYKILRDPGVTMENTTQLFLAVRFNCNKCHDHPFERWTQDQYYQLAGYFARVSRKEDPGYRNQKVGGTNVDAAVPLVEVVFDATQGDVKHERTGAVTAPNYPYKHPGMPPGEGTRRQQLARWVASKDNPYFAKSYVNRLWSYLLGIGLIEPIDDIRAGNPPSNPKLLDRLTEEFIRSDFNVQDLVKTICKSRVYQQSIQTNRWNQDDDINYSHAMAKRLPAEALFDSIYRVMGITPNLSGMPAGLRAVQQLDTNVEVPSGFLDLFGRPPRESACECERSGGMMLGPVLNLVNGPVIGEAIKDPQNRIGKLVAAYKDDSRVVEELFMAVLSRPPTQRELATGLQALRGNEADFTRLTAEHNKHKEALAAHERTFDQRLAAWQKAVRASGWEVLMPKSTKAAGGATLTSQPDGSILASGKVGHPETYTVTADSKLGQIKAIRLEVLPDPSLPKKGPGRMKDGNFVLSHFRATASPSGQPGKVVSVKFSKATADFAQDSFAISRALFETGDSGWGIAPAYGQRHVGVFEIDNAVGFAKGTTLTISLDHKFYAPGFTIGKFRLSVAAVAPPTPPQGLPENIAAIIRLEPAKQSAAQKAELAAYFKANDPELARLQRELAAHPLPGDQRLLGAQDLAWALLNSPAFLFNH